MKKVKKYKLTDSPETKEPKRIPMPSIEQEEKEKEEEEKEE